MTIADVSAYGYEKAVMHSEQLAIGKWGNLWYIIDMVCSGEIGKPSSIGTPTKARWLAVEQADARIREGHYR